jgi:hypothetical protein
MSATGGSVEESLTWQQLRDKMDGARINGSALRVIRVDSTGLHVSVDWKDGRLRAYLLTDLNAADPAVLIQGIDIVSGLATTINEIAAGTAKALVVSVTGAAVGTTKGDIGAIHQIAGEANALDIAGNDADNSANSVNKLPTLSARGNAAAPSWTEGNQVPLSADLSGRLRILQTPLATLIEDDDLPPTSLAAASVEVIKITGATALALGQRVTYNLSGEPGTVTGAGIFIYVAIKGATSGKYYAVCQVGSTVSGYFDVPQAEKLNIVWRNSDATNAHVMSGHWTAMSP